MFGNDVLWLKMAENSWKWLDWLEMAENGWKWLELGGMSRKWLEMSGNGWKCLGTNEITMMMLENQMGWPYHSLDCVFSIVWACAKLSSLANGIHLHFLLNCT